MATDKFVIKFGGDVTELTNSVKKAQGAIDGFSKSVMTSFAGIAAGVSLIGIGKEMIDVTARFERFGAILTNTLGSNSAAQKALADIKQFSIETPFEVSEITAAYVRWANQGLSPTIEKMKKLGDVASSLGAGFEQTAEAFKDLMVGQTKRLEEIGIAAEAIRGTNELKLSFKGVTIEIEKNAEGVQKALDIYSQLNGVLGTSDAIAKTLGGKISNLSDQWTNFLAETGKGLSGATSEGIGTLQNALQNATMLSLILQGRFREGLGLPELKDDVERLKKEFEELDIAMASVVFGGGSNTSYISQLIVDFGKELTKLKPISESNIHLMETEAYLSEKLSKLKKESLDQVGEQRAAINLEIDGIEAKIKALQDLGKAELSYAQQKALASRLANLGSVTPEMSEVNNKFSFGNYAKNVKALSSIITLQQHMTEVTDAATESIKKQGDEMDNGLEKIARLSESFGEGFGYMASGAESFAVSIKKMANNVVGELYRIAQMQLIAKSAALGPIGLAASVAGLAVLRGLVGGLLSSTGSRSYSGSNSSYSGIGNNRFGPLGQRIELYGNVQVQGRDLQLVLNNNSRYDGRTKMG